MLYWSKIIVYHTNYFIIHIYKNIVYIRNSVTYIDKRGKFMTNANYSSLENLSENKVFLQTILDLSIKGLMVIDCEGKIIFINKSFEEIHNVSHDEVIGKHVTEIIENT